jgi:nitrous oxidase accessory protein NosD
MRNIKTNFIKFGLFVFFVLVFFTTKKSFAADIYVDTSNQTGIEDGSMEYPYSTIAAALIKSASNLVDQRNIEVRSGSYLEGELSLPDYTTLTGTVIGNAIIDREGLKGATITMGKDSSLINITVRGGNYGIIIPEYTKSTIRSCTIEKTNRIGIWIKQNNKMIENSVEIWDSSISNNYQKGIYGESRFIYIRNNQIKNNGEEGIDFRSKMRGTISGNTVERNSEGGIELEIRQTAIEISGNNLNYNHSNGITLNNRTRVGGKVIIKNNVINNNYHYGIRCTGTKNWSKKLWRKSIQDSKNSIAKNVRKNISKSCKVK